MTVYAAMTGEIAGHVAGCPQYTLENSVRKVVRDLCRRGRVWRDFATDITLVPGTYSYTIVPTQAQAEVVAVLYATTTINTVKRDIPYVGFAVARKLYPSWPEESDGNPEIITSTTLGPIQTAPVPDTAGVLSPYVVLAPTLASTLWDTAMYDRHERAIFHGVLYDLMLMPNRVWSNTQLGAVHGKQWTYLLNDARISAEHGYNTSDVFVQQRPMA